MDSELEKGFKTQINEELYSAYLYLSMSSYFEEKNLEGFAHWMRVQFQEELMHAMKFINHMTERGAKVELKPIEKPDCEWDSPEHVFEAVCEHEQYITNCIHRLADQAENKNDRAAFSFLKWFIDEQVEEEDTVDNILQKVRMFGKDQRGLFMIDKDLGGRTFKQQDYPEELQLLGFATGNN